MGAIQKIKENEVYNFFDCASGSNASPILLWDYKAIGMHKQIEHNIGISIEHRAFVPIRHGNRLLAIAVFQLAVLRYTRKIVN